MKYYAIIVGGGSGSRMQSDVPKQFLLLLGKPVMMHTIEAFHNSDLHPEIIVVLHPDFHPYWEQLCRDYEFHLPHFLVNGGENRFYSVKNGLEAVKKTSVVAIHDAVRPIINNDIITNSFKQAEISGNAVAVIPSKDSVRQLVNATSIALNREDIFLVQTPQTFKSDILKKAYEQPYEIGFTDDASVIEKNGNSIKFIPGDVKNIKITYPEDLSIAELFLNKKH